LHPHHRTRRTTHLRLPTTPLLAGNPRTGLHSERPRTDRRPPVATAGHRRRRRPGRRTGTRRRRTVERRGVSPVGMARAAPGTVQAGQLAIPGNLETGTTPAAARPGTVRNMARRTTQPNSPHRNATSGALPHRDRAVAFHRTGEGRRPPPDRRRDRVRSGSASTRTTATRNNRQGRTDRRRGVTAGRPGNRTART